MPGGIDRRRWTHLADLGLLLLEDPVDCAVIAETLGRSNAVDPWLETGYFPLRVLRGGPWADGVADGSRLAAVAFAERGRRFALDPRSMRASARGGGWVLSGAKTFVLNGPNADLFVVTAQKDGGPALFAVEAAHAGLRAYTVVDGGAAAEIELRDAPGALIEGACWADVLADVRLMAAAETVGLAQRLLDDTLDYVRGREQFGQAVGRFQAVQHRLVDCYTMLELMRSLLLRTAIGRSGPSWHAAAAGAKAFISEHALHIGEEAIQLHGGMGVTDELDIGHAHKRVMLLSKLLGDPASEHELFAAAA